MRYVVFILFFLFSYSFTQAQVKRKHTTQKRQTLQRQSFRHTTQQQRVRTIHPKNIRQNRKKTQQIRQRSSRRNSLQKRKLRTQKKLYKTTHQYIIKPRKQRLETRNFRKNNQRSSLQRQSLRVNQQALNRLRSTLKRQPTTLAPPKSKTQSNTSLPTKKTTPTSSKINRSNYDAINANTPTVLGNSVIKLDKVVVVAPLRFNTRAERRKYLILKYKTEKVWPYAVLAAERLTTLQKRLATIHSKRDRKRYTKYVQEYVEGKFKDRLKKLTKSEGQILVKLIYRQTGETTYNIVRHLRSGWRAFWYNVTANLFTISLKETYDPASVKQDYYIEHILRQDFRQNKLEFQKPAIDINYSQIGKKWR